jgi:hypothetical protein
MLKFRAGCYSESKLSASRSYRLETSIARATPGTLRQINSFRAGNMRMGLNHLVSAGCTLPLAGQAARRLHSDPTKLPSLER